MNRDGELAVNWSAIRRNFRIPSWWTPPCYLSRSAEEGVQGVASLIEQQLYGSYGAHALLSITLAVRRVIIEIAPWADLAAVTVVVFEWADLRHVWSAHDKAEAEFALPWDIIGFDSADLGGGL